MLLFRSLVGISSFLAVSTLIIIIVILSKFGGNNDENGDGNNDESWWEMWEGREAEERGQLMFAGVWMLLVLSFLSVAGFKTFRAPTMFRVGVLAGSMVMYANLALVVCFFFMNLEGEEEGGNNNNNQDRRYMEENNNYNNNQQREEEEEGRGQRILSIFGLVLFIAYGALSAFTLWISKSFAQDHGVNELEKSQSSGHVDVLADAFKHLSVFSVIGIAITFIIGFLSLFTEDAERMREEGFVYNFLLVSAFVLLIVVGLAVAGYRIFRRNPSITQLEVGFFNGCLYFFCGVTLLLAGLYGGFSLEGLGEGRRGAPEGPIGSLFFAFLCFTFAVAYLSYGALLSKFHPSVLHANRDSIESEYNEMSGENATSGVEFASIAPWQNATNDGSGKLQKNDGAVQV